MPTVVVCSKRDYLCKARKGNILPCTTRSLGKKSEIEWAGEARHTGKAFDYENIGALSCYANRNILRLSIVVFCLRRNDLKG